MAHRSDKKFLADVGYDLRSIKDRSRTPQNDTRIVLKAKHMAIPIATADHRPLKIPLSMHPLSKEDRRRLNEHMRAELHRPKPKLRKRGAARAAKPGKRRKYFTKTDYAYMEKAVDVTESAFFNLRDHAPDPKDLAKQYEAIQRAAHELHKLLRPSMIEHTADLRS